MGIDDPDKLHPGLIQRYIDVGIVINYAEIFPQLSPSELVSNNAEETAFDRDWEIARSDNFN